MKKTLIFVICSLILVGCSKDNVNDDSAVEIKEPEIIEEVKEYIDDNPVKIAFYENNKILEEYNTNSNPQTDINVFSVIFTNDKEISGNSYKTQFNTYYNKYENNEKYKIGYYIKFNVGNKVIEKTITDPSSIFSLTPYLCIYLYDDIHQEDGVWYSHVEESDVKSDTLYTSIKLFMVENIKDVSSPIILEAFTYDSEDDFDEYGNYRGNSKYSININLN